MKIAVLTIVSRRGEMGEATHRARVGKYVFGEKQDRKKNKRMLV